MKTIIIITALILVSCTSEYHIRKAVVKRGAQGTLDLLLKEFPELSKNKQVIYDTVLIKHNGFDTVKVTQKTDSIIINNYGTITKVYRHYDTIRVLSLPRVDTIIKPLYVEKFIYSKPEKTHDWLGWLVIGVVVLFIFGVSYKMMKQ